jgi:transposase
MAQNFIECDRERAFLMPPSLREWLPEDHLAWFVLEAVEEMDLSEFYADYRSDGHGRAAYEPSMMVALLLYAYATAQRSSRGIEIHCRQDIGYRVVAANRVPDHATIARFLARHEAALADLFGSVLALCARAGLVSTGVVAIDGTKLKANASREANLDYGRIAREIVAEAKATDGAEDELYGEARGDELPAELRTREGRRRWLSEAKRRRSMPSRPIRRRPQLSPPSPPTSLPQSRAAGRSTRVAAGGTATPASASTSAVSARRDRSRARAGRGFRSQSAASRRSFRLSARQTRPTRPTARAGLARRAPLRRRSAEPPPAAPTPLPARSTRPTRLAAAQGDRRLRAGLQRAGGGQRAADRARGRDQRRIARLRAARADGRRDRLRA